MSECYCGKDLNYDVCCGKYINGSEQAPDPEALMRSRYSAYVNGEIQYIMDTVSPENRGEYDLESIKIWSEQSKWLELEIINCETEDDSATVEFKAKYIADNKEINHHELSTFKKLDGVWFFHNGEEVHGVENKQIKIGRNEPCPCGSGKKYKKCCGK